LLVLVLVLALLALLVLVLVLLALVLLMSLLTLARSHVPRQPSVVPGNAPCLLLPPRLLVLVQVLPCTLLAPRLRLRLLVPPLRRHCSSQVQGGAAARVASASPTTLSHTLLQGCRRTSKSGLNPETHAAAAACALCQASHVPLPQHLDYQHLLPLGPLPLVLVLFGSCRPVAVRHPHVAVLPPAALPLW
jgi:hypothetical protein